MNQVPVQQREPESDLDNVLRTGIECMQGLKALLEKERSALEERDPDELAQTAELKQALVTKLAGFVELNQVIADTEQLPRRLAGHARDFANIARECEQLNRTNGAIIRSRHDQVAQGLSVLRGVDTSDDTYSVSGSAPTASGRRSLTEA